MWRKLMVNSWMASPWLLKLLFVIFVLSVFDKGFPAAEARLKSLGDSSSTTRCSKGKWLGSWHTSFTWKRIGAQTCRVHPGCRVLDNRSSTM